MSQEDWVYLVEIDMLEVGTGTGGIPGEVVGLGVTPVGTTPLGGGGAVSTPNEGTTDVVRTHGFSAPDRLVRKSLYSGVLYPALLISSINIETQISHPILGVSGVTSTSFGVVTLALPASYDWITLRYFEGRRILVLRGHPDESRAQFTTLFDGTIVKATWTEQTITFQVQDPGVLADKELQLDHYTGADDIENGGNPFGSYDANAAVEGQPKPLTFGYCRQVPAVPINNVYLIYQVHAGPVGYIVPVYDGGSEMALHGDVSDVFAASVPNETYVTDLSRGIFRLGSMPYFGTLTADVLGDIADEDTEDGFQRYTGEIVRRIAKGWGGITNVSDAKVQALDGARQYLAGYHTQSPANIREVIDFLIEGVIATWGFNPTTCALEMDPLGLSDPVATISHWQVLRIELEDIAAPIHHIRVGYAKSYQTQTRGEQAADPDIPAFLRDLLTNEYRWIEQQSDPGTRHLLPRQLDLETALKEKPGAQAMALLISNLSGIYTRRFLYRVDCAGILFTLKAGQTVQLIHPRFGLNSGRNMLCLSVADDAGSGRTTLKLWG